MNVRELARDGIWSNNPALVQLLGLCPLLAVSNTATTALGLGLVTLVILTLSNVTISLLRHFLVETTRLPMQILVIATFVTIADLALQAWLFELHQRIGLFVALIVTNCTLLGRAESFASRQPVAASLVDGLMMGFGFLLAILLLGVTREFLGHGTVFAHLYLLTGGEPPAQSSAGGGFLLALLPPGAFILLGCLVALKNLVDAPANETTEEVS